MDNIKKLTIILTGGGTGGHLIPLLPIIGEIKKIAPQAEILLVTRKEDLGYINHEDKSFKIKTIQSGKWRRYFSWLNFTDFFKVSAGLIQSLIIIWQFKPNVVFSKGGFVSIPVIVAARILKVPIIAHESDVVTGLSNKIAARWAKLIACGFEKRFYLDLPQSKLEFVGSPLREDFIEESKKIAKRELKIGNKVIKTDQLILLVFGSSQGAHRINELLLPSLPRLLEEITVIHISGRGDYNWLENETKSFDKKLLANYHLYSFITEEMAAIMNRADLVISRTSASALGELAILQKPVIAIPLSTSASNHQWHNAKILEREGAIRLLDERKIGPNDLALEILDLMKDKKLRNSLSQNIRQFAHPDAAQKIAKLIIENANK